MSTVHSVTDPTTDPLIDVADETFVLCAPHRIGEYITSPQHWRLWFPTLDLTVLEERGDLGVRWRASGELAGTAEIWIEPVKDGAVLHLFLRGRARARSSKRARRHASAKWALHAKTVAFSIKDALEEAASTRR